MTEFLAICGLSAVVGCLGGRFLPRALAFALAVICAAILPMAASVLAWPPKERTVRGIFNLGWFSHEAVGMLTIPWVLCLVLAVVGVIAGRWLGRAGKI
jgi:hypothetical protein